MPIYDYTCGSCGQVTEVIHGINAEGPRFCPSCGAEGTMRKALSAPAIVFKGSGWAKVDRRSGSGGGSSARSSTKPSSSSSAGSSTSPAAGGDGGSTSTETGSKRAATPADGGGD